MKSAQSGYICLSFVLTNHVASKEDTYFNVKSKPRPSCWTWTSGLHTIPGSSSSLYLIYMVAGWIARFWHMCVRLTLLILILKNYLFISRNGQTEQHAYVISFQFMDSEMYESPFKVVENKMRKQLLVIRLFFCKHSLSFVHCARHLYSFLLE